MLRVHFHCSRELFCSSLFLCKGVRSLQRPSQWSYTTDSFLNKLCKPRTSTSKQKPRLNTVVCRTFSSRISLSSCPKNLPHIPQASCTGSVAHSLVLSQSTPGTERTFCSTSSSCKPELPSLQWLPSHPMQPCPNQTFLGDIPLTPNSSPQSSFMCQVGLSSP